MLPCFVTMHRRARWFVPAGFLLLPWLAGAQPTLQVVPEKEVMYSGLVYRVAVKLVRGSEMLPEGVAGVEWTLAAPSASGELNLVAQALPPPGEDFFAGARAGDYAMEVESLADPVPGGWRSERTVSASSGSGESGAEGMLASFWFECRVATEDPGAFSLPEATLTGKGGEVFSVGAGTLAVISPQIEFRVGEPDLGRYLAAFREGVIDPSEGAADWDRDGFSNRLEWVLRQRPDQADRVAISWESSAIRWTATILFQRATDPATLGLEVHPQVTGGLSGTAWEGASSVQPLGTFPGGELMRAQFFLPRGAGPPRSFYRFALVDSSSGS